MSKELRSAVREIVNDIQREKVATRREQLKVKLLKVVGEHTFKAVLGPNALASSKAGQDDDVDNVEEMADEADEADESEIDAAVEDKESDEREEALSKHAKKQVQKLCNLN
jgi:hypothetical protein